VQRTDQYGNATTFVYDAFGNLSAEYGPPVDRSSPATQATERHDFQPFGFEINSTWGTWRSATTGYGE
jgi:hypothetical protein